MSLIRGLARITPAPPMQKKAPDGSESESGWQIVIQSLRFLLGNILKPKQEAQ